MERNVIIDEVFGEDILHLEDVVNEYVNSEELQYHKLISLNMEEHVGSDGREFVGAKLAFVKIIH